LKNVTRVNAPQLTAFEYRGTPKSRERLLEMSFCSAVGCAGDEDIWISDRDRRYFVGPHDWIVVEGLLVIDVLDEAMFEDRYEVVGEAC
jgi:hypothetical protein